jgi:acyl carrier protein phosphodiesterase
MNLLAHALLAGADDDVRFGSLIGDFVRGPIDPALAPGVRAGIVLHRRVDARTDAHPRVVAARALFEPPFRRYAGILLDVWFDHRLAREWSRYGDGGNLEAFSDRVRALLEARTAQLPPRMRRFAAYLHANGLPAAYRDEAAIARALDGLSTRLSRSNPLAAALPELQQRADALADAFADFFPQLAAYARAERERLERELR